MQTSFLPHVIEYIIYIFAFLPLAVALFDTRCSIVYQFTFLSRTADSFNILHFCHTILNFVWIYIFAATLVVALIVHLHFCRLFVCIDNKFTFFAAHCCILCTFRFCHLLLLLHCLQIYIFAACCCIIYIFTFCRLFFHCLRFFFVLQILF